MSRLVIIFFPVVLFSICIAAQAQMAMQTSGALIIVPAFGEVKHANDEAHLTLMVEEQDKDSSAAASRVNQKMKQGIEIVKREDPQATFKTGGYYTYPIYPEELPRPNNKTRQPTGWRVGHHLEVTTTNLNGLPKTVAAVQHILALNGLYFDLSDTTRKKLDDKRIEAAYRNLTERIAAIAKAMGRTGADAVLETVDFEGSGAYAQQASAVPKIAMRAAGMQEDVPIAEPSFEPGETTLQMQIVGKVKFR